MVSLHRRYYMSFLHIKLKWQNGKIAQEEIIFFTSIFQNFALLTIQLFTILFCFFMLHKTKVETKVIFSNSSFASKF